MKCHAVLFASLIAILSISSSCYGHENPSEPEAATDVPEIQKPGQAEVLNAGPEIPEIQKPGEAGTANDIPEIQKPDEAEAMEAAIAFLNRDGRLTIQKSEFMAWGTFSEKLAYWPMKLRLTYKTGGSDTVRQNDYAVKISKDINGKLKAAQYYAWRTDFK